VDVDDSEPAVAQRDMSGQPQPSVVGAAAGGPFAILRFAEPDLPDIVYLEQLTSALYLDKRSDVEHYALVMDRLCAHIEPPDRTAAIIDAIRKSI
jgi:hypothetical protein